MAKQITLLGCAVEYLPVIFDLCYDTFGSEEFHVYKNIEVHSLPEMPNKSQEYKMHFYESGDTFKRIGENVIFGVTGPFGKQKVFHHFNKNWGIGREGIDSLIHPAAVLSPSVELESAVLIEPGVVISSQTHIGFGVTIKRSASIGHHCRIGDFVEINPGVTISGRVKISEGSIIGSGAILRDGVSIGRNSVVGMGSIVTKDIPDGVVAYGNPCEVVRKNEVRE